MVCWHAAGYPEISLFEAVNGPLQLKGSIKGGGHFYPQVGVRVLVAVVEQDLLPINHDLCKFCI